jgi:hypothetical protein
MKIKSLISKFWQELFFIIPVVIFLIDTVIGSKIFEDWLGITTYCFHLFFLIFLIRQFFNVNKILSFILIIFVGLYSMFWIFASLYMVMENSNKILPTILLIVALFSIFPVITLIGKIIKINKLS